ncbi:MAG: 2Fe-2S iron-sulfur cluster binding domain-containing protein [Austwickia sp.]|nr:2Fe-2S iron-sulfur cluster binding domain-containing protein [Austwickia sp.]MBK8435144.1 2Fe-2S iron-sulfur cluster binding domain-containing protein [Austwickia sp.]MBK9101302.1 2Fe-2S iron-sulfur cluster binding domain-containing protein [Austwickia sp.]
MSDGVGHQIRLHPSDHVVAVHPGDTVLEALERAGYALPNNCRAGACGECKVKVLGGEYDQGFVLDMALAPEEREAGYGLMCMAKPLSAELVVEWGTPDARPSLFPPRYGLPFVVVDRIGRTPRITEFVLRPLGESLRFWPGQYVRIGDEDAGVPTRSYSLASVPQPDGELRLHVTRVDGGATSRWLHELPAGARVSVDGAFGTFVGDPSARTPVLALAAGSGLAPILALTEAALRRGFTDPVTLVFSARTQADLYDQGLLSYWQERYPNFRAISTLTGESVEGLQHGRVPEVLPDLLGSLEEHSVYVAGVPAFVDACVARARIMGARDALIHTEGFYPQDDDESAARC